MTAKNGFSDTRDTAKKPGHNEPELALFPIPLTFLSMTRPLFRIGTCSWKYDSWKGLIYSDTQKTNYLEQYSRHYQTVEVDQWFWSLFAGNKAVLPKRAVVEEYANAVPEGFTFSIKVPNSITLTHHYRKKKGEPLVANPHFLSAHLMERFLESLQPLGNKIGPLNFQFEYLNKEKMAGQAAFLQRFATFIEALPPDYTYCLETRNPNYINERYFDFLDEYGIHHVFLQGYYMPSIFELYQTYRERIHDLTVIRLHGPDRKAIEETTGNDWSKIVAPKEQDIARLAAMLSDLAARKVKAYAFVNNHFEGSAPRTIEKITDALASGGG